MRVCLGHLEDADEGHEVIKSNGLKRKVGTTLLERGKKSCPFL